MKFIWEAADIKPGRVVGKAGRQERWMIAYTPSPTARGNLFTLVSLSDGLISSEPLTAAIIAVRLTGNGEMPAECL